MDSTHPAFRRVLPCRSAWPISYTVFISPSFFAERLWQLFEAKLYKPPKQFNIFLQGRNIHLTQADFAPLIEILPAKPRKKVSYQFYNRWTLEKFNRAINVQAIAFEASCA
jgi:hypothetical protein